MSVYQGLTEETGVIICNHVFHRERKIGLIVHHNDDGWQFTCGAFDHENKVSALALVHLRHILEVQPELIELLKLNKGELAELIDGEWHIEKHDV